MNRLALLSAVLLLATGAAAACEERQAVSGPAPAGTQVLGAAVPAAPSPAHTPMGHEQQPVPAGGVTALVLVRRLDGLNEYEGGEGIVGERFGIFALAEDMDGDGVADLIVGAPRADPGGASGGNEGSIYVFSGAELLEGRSKREALLYRVDGESTANGTGELGFRQGIAVADLNGDGILELLAGAWLADPAGVGGPVADAGSVFVFDGAVLRGGGGQAAALLFRMDGEAGSRLGRPTAVVGDVNKDGAPDFFVGAHRASPGSLKFAGSGFLISGKDFAILHRFDGAAANDFLGRSVMPAGDLNSDGWPDLAIGASQGDGGQAGGVPTGPGYVNVYSGKDFSLLARLTPPLEEPTGSFGQTTIYVPKPGVGTDFNGDGAADILVGSPEARAGLQGPPGKEGLPRTGSVYVYSGVDFSLLRRFDGERESTQGEGPSPQHESPQTGTPAGNIGDVFGDAVAVIPDVDGDGVPEILAGAPRGDGRSLDGSYPPELADSGYAKIFSGKTGTLLARINGAGKSTNMGHHVLAVGDLNKDGHPDLLIGSDLTDFGGTDAGSVYWYSVSVKGLAK